ncbi:MAG: VCBS repeat-containing protein, partial [Pseudomonadota bacterium]
MISSDIAHIGDVDDDGDIDILSWSVSGNRVDFHKNYAMENDGNCDSLRLQIETGCWGDFAESAINNQVILNAPCRSEIVEEDDRPALSSAAHTGGTILALDLDDDRDKEIVIGDISFDNLVALTNGGDLNSALITSSDTVFPMNNQSTIPAEVYTFPAAYYLDVDNDSVKDLIVAPNVSNGGENFSNVWLYKNEGTDSLPAFTYQSNRFLSDGMIELGTGAHPTFYDIDADGKKDLIVGNFGYSDAGAGDFDSKLAYYRNVGSTGAPEYELISRDYFGLSAEDLFGIYPTFGDLDGDGDDDLLVGHVDGVLSLFENISGSGNPSNYSLSELEYADIDVGSAAAPQLIDLNRDGLLDLVIGERSGTIQYYANTGTATNAVFSDVPTIDSLGVIDVEEDCCTGFATPTIYENQDGDYEMLVGSEDGTIYFYVVDESNLTAPFVLYRTLKTRSHQISVAVEDLVGDAIPEIVYGEFQGGIG